LILFYTELEGWIPDTFRLFAVCRSGLTVEEIFAILKTLGYRNTREVKSYDWLQFMDCVGNFLHEKTNGLVDFSHQHLKEIVEYVLLRKYFWLSNLTIQCIMHVQNILYRVFTLFISWIYVRFACINRTLI
jgi:hypothetical protein